MISNYKSAYYETVVNYDLVFDDGHFNGCGFPCDKDGNLLPNIPKEAKKNYQDCLNHPERYVRFNKIASLQKSINLFASSSSTVTKCQVPILRVTKKRSSHAHNRT